MTIILLKPSKFTTLGASGSFPLKWQIKFEIAKSQGVASLNEVNVNILDYINTFS